MRKFEGFRAQTLGKGIALPRVVAEPKRFVYILKSVNTAGAYYVGVTSDMEKRLEAHNAGLSPHTAEARPWRRLVVVEFDEELPVRKST